MRKILWLSRHDIDGKQMSVLKKQFGPCEFKHVRKEVKSADTVLELMKKHKAETLVAILPVKITQELLKQGVQPIRPVMKREKTDDGICFEFSHFERVEKIEVVTRKLA